MVAREKLPVLGYNKPVCIHVPLLHGLDGEVKMSSSKGNYISVDDDPLLLKSKMLKAFCPPKIVKDNPVIEYVEHFVFPELGVMKINRAAKHGGSIEIKDAAELRRNYTSGQLHPADLKASLTEALIQVLAPVREYFQKYPEARLANKPQF